MVEILLIILAFVFVIALCFMFFMEIRQREKERNEHAVERAILLDRIQAKDFTEFKTQERIDNKPPAPKKEVNPLDKERWQ